MTEQLRGESNFLSFEERMAPARAKVEEFLQSQRQGANVQETVIVQLPDGTPEERYAYLEAKNELNGRTFNLIRDEWEQDHNGQNHSGNSEDAFPKDSNASKDYAGMKNWAEESVK